MNLPDKTDELLFRSCQQHGWQTPKGRSLSFEGWRRTPSTLYFGYHNTTTFHSFTVTRTLSTEFRFDFLYLLITGSVCQSWKTPPSDLNIFFSVSSWDTWNVSGVFSAAKPKSQRSPRSLPCLALPCLPSMATGKPFGNWFSQNKFGYLLRLGRGRCHIGDFGANCAKTAHFGSNQKKDQTMGDDWILRIYGSRSDWPFVTPAFCFVGEGSRAQVLQRSFLRLCKCPWNCAEKRFLSSVFFLLLIYKETETLRLSVSSPQERFEQTAEKHCRSFHRRLVLLFGECVIFTNHWNLSAWSIVLSIVEVWVYFLFFFGHVETHISRFFLPGMSVTVSIKFIYLKLKGRTL